MCCFVAFSPSLQTSSFFVAIHIRFKGAVSMATMTMGGSSSGGCGGGGDYPGGGWEKKLWGDKANDYWPDPDDDDDDMDLSFVNALFFVIRSIGRFIIHTKTSIHKITCQLLPRTLGSATTARSWGTFARKFV